MGRVRASPTCGPRLCKWPGFLFPPWHLSGRRLRHRVFGIGSSVLVGRRPRFFRRMSMTFSPLMRKAVLDLVCGGATPTRPGARWLALTDTTGDEFSVSGYARLTASFDAATFNSASMLSAQTFGRTASSVLWVGSFRVYDASILGSELFGSAFQTPISAKANGAGFCVKDLGISLS